MAGISGRVALPAAYLGARAAGVPFVLWATIWRHPRTAAHALSYLPLRHIYRHADAIATYGPHVSAYVRGKGARGPVFEAPQSVDDGFWRAPAGRAATRLPGLVAGSAGGGEGVDGAAVRPGANGLAGLEVALVAGRRRSVTGAGRRRRRDRPAGPLPPAAVRSLYAGSDVVVVPSIPTRDFLEPWGLVANEAMNRECP